MGEREEVHFFKFKLLLFQGMSSRIRVEAEQKDDRIRLLGRESCEL